MKKKLTVLSLLLLCFTFVVSGTLAYFTSEEKAHNVITSGLVDIELLEWADEAKKEPFPTTGVEVMPGHTVTKIVEVKNTGKNDAWVCINVQKNIQLDPEKGEEPESSVVEIDFNETDWSKGENGLWYYNKILKPNETTAPLFKEVTFKGPEMDNLYANSTTVIHVEAAAVQTDNNIPESNKAADAKGWPDFDQE